MRRTQTVDHRHHHKGCIGLTLLPFRLFLRGMRSSRDLDCLHIIQYAGRKRQMLGSIWIDDDTCCIVIYQTDGIVQTNFQGLGLFSTHKEVLPAFQCRPVREEGEHSIFILHIIVVQGRKCQLRIRTQRELTILFLIVPTDMHGQKEDGGLHLML